MKKRKSTSKSGRRVARESSRRIANKRPLPTWPPDEVAFLHEHAEKWSYGRIAMTLGRTEENVRTKWRELSGKTHIRTRPRDRTSIRPRSCFSPRHLRWFVENGHRDYRSYRMSPHWRKICMAYPSSGLPQECLGCGREEYILHHLTYDRLGQERLFDLVPLCGLCHPEVHKIHRDRGIDLMDVYVVLPSMFYWPLRETLMRLRPYLEPGSSGLTWSQSPELADPDQERARLDASALNIPFSLPSPPPRPTGKPAWGEVVKGRRRRKDWGPSATRSPVRIMARGPAISVPPPKHEDHHPDPARTIPRAGWDALVRAPVSAGEEC